MKKVYTGLLSLFLWAAMLIALDPELLLEAQYYEKLRNELVKCSLCPNYCVLKPGETGLCRARQNIGGRLFTLVYNRPVAIHVDPVEKKPLYHFYPGSQVLSLATAGCNLRCNFCQNWTISQVDPLAAESYDLTPGEIINLAHKYSCEAIAFTYTEPTVFFEYMIDIAKLAQEQDIKTIWVTCGYINQEPLQELCSFIDAANIDLKGYSEEFYRTYTTGSLQPVLKSIETAARNGIFVEITNLVIPQANDEIWMIEDMCQWLGDNLGYDTPLHFSRFFPNYKLTNRPATPIKKLEEFHREARDSGFKYVYIGNVPGSAEDTYCPECGKMIIDRSGYYIEKINMKGNRCAFCGSIINGVFN